MSSSGLDVMLAFFDAARRARGPVPPTSRAKRTPRAPSSTRTGTTRAPRSRPPRWVVDVPEDGEHARVLIVRSVSDYPSVDAYGVHTRQSMRVLEYVDCESWTPERWPIELGNLECVLTYLALDATVLRVLRIEALR